MASPPPVGEESAKHSRSPLFRAAQLVTLVGVAGLLGLLVWRLASQGEGKQLVKDVAADKRPAAPAFRLKVIWPRVETWPAGLRAALGDGRISLAELRGYPVAINFWASWCDPCKAEAGRLAAAARAHAGRVVFLGIDVQDFESDAGRFLKRYRANYVSVRDGGNSTYDRYGLTGLPETYFVDRRGRIVAHKVGEISADELEQGLAAISAQRGQRR